MEIKEKYILYLRDHEELVPSTLREYTRMLNLFYEEANGHPFIPIRMQSEYEDIIKSIQHRFRWSAGTRYRMSILIEGFGRFAYRERVIERVPYENTFKKGNGKRLEFFSEDEFYKMAFNPFHSISDFIMTILFWDCGMRKQELINLNIEDVDLNNRLIKIVNNKTGKPRLNPIREFTKCLLVFYMICLGLQGKLKRGNPLFYSPTWERIHESTLARHMKVIEVISRIRVFAHKFRHSLGGRIVAAGGDLSLVKELLGHENLSTTAIYMHFATNKKRFMYDELLDGENNPKKVVDTKRNLEYASH